VSLVVTKDHLVKFSPINLLNPWFKRVLGLALLHVELQCLIFGRVWSFYVHVN